MAGLWYSTPRNPLCRSLILDLLSLHLRRPPRSRLDQLLFWLPLSIFSIPSWSLQPSVRCPVLSTMVPAPSGSLPHSQSPLGVGLFQLRKCMCLVHSYSSLVLIFRLLSSTSSCLPLLSSAAGLPASTSGFSCWAPGFHFCLQLLGSRLPLLASAVGLSASTSGFSCWATGFYFWLQLLGSRLPLLTSASVFHYWAPGFLFWLLASDFCLLRLTKIKSAYSTLSTGLYTLCPAGKACWVVNSQSEAGICHPSAT